MKTRKAPPGIELVRDKLEEFESRSREALEIPIDDKRRNEISWPMHKIHYEKNRYLFDMRYKHHQISKKLLDYLIKEKLADGKLMAKWKRPGYERLCSLLVITNSNTNFGTVGVCRTPLKQRMGQIMPNILTGCVACASGDGGPIWWDDPVPEIVKKRIAEIDPGKARLVTDAIANQEDTEGAIQNDQCENEEEEGNAEQVTKPVEKAANESPA